MIVFGVERDEIQEDRFVTQMDQAEGLEGDGEGTGVAVGLATNGNTGQQESPAAGGDVNLSSMRNMSDLFNPPPHLESVRRRLFEVKEKVELTVDEWKLYWPYVDNVWCKTQSRRLDTVRSPYETHYYACRLHRATYEPDPKRVIDESKPKRKKQRREGGTCQIRLKVVLFHGICQSYTITQVGDCKEHTHDLDYIDKVKRNTVIMEIVRSEVMKGYVLPSVFALMNEDAKKLATAGGRYLSRSDMSNASAAWRHEHPTELVCHEFYKFEKGKGILKKPDFRLPSILENRGPSTSPELPSDTIYFPIESRTFLEKYLPQSPETGDTKLPWVTLTYATSMDSALSLAPGMQTILSGPESKAMTHFLRSRHDAILVGVGTAVADDPGLNCRLAGVGGYGGIGWDGQPRPVIVDPSARWLLTPQSRILKNVKDGKGRAPWMVITPGAGVQPERIEMLKHYGGTYLGLLDYSPGRRFRWEGILQALGAQGIRSVMIEGGGAVLNELLNPEYAAFIDSVIVTIAPTYLGRGGVVVSPERRTDETGSFRAAVKFTDVKWQPLGEDVVMCGKLQSPS